MISVETNAARITVFELALLLELDPHPATARAAAAHASVVATVLRRPSCIVIAHSSAPGSRAPGLEASGRG